MRPPRPKPKPRPRHRRLNYLPGLALLLALAACAPEPHWRTTNIDGHLPTLRFALRDDEAAPVTAADERGHTVLLYFGYTGCGTQCPLTVARLAALAQADRNVRVLFVSVTPQLDTPAILHAYLSAYGPDLVSQRRLTGLTGPVADVAEVARRYRAAFPQGASVQDFGPDLAHSNLVYVFDRQGRARLLIRPEDRLDAIRHDLDQLP